MNPKKPAKTQGKATQPIQAPPAAERRGVPRWLPSLLILLCTGVLFLILFFNAREGL